MSNLATITNNILADSGIDDLNVVVTTGSYSNPAWITALAWTKITGAPSNIVTGTGAATQIAYWGSSSSITGENDLVWDATNNRMGVGVVTPSASIHIEGTGSTYSTPASSNVPGIYIQNTNGSSSTANTFLSLRTTGASGGDPILSWDIGGVIGWSAGIDNSDGDSFKIANYWAGVETNTRFTIDGSGKVRFNAYGGGSFTGTVAYNLAVDASGNVIETAGGVVDGSGTTNYVPKWSDPNTLTNSLIYDNGTNVAIGTTSPINTGLTVQTSGATFSTTATKNSNMYGLTLVSTTNENTMSGVWFGSGGGVHWSGIAGSRSNYTVDWSTHLSFYTHIANTVNITEATEKMRITGDGNVGINTTTPQVKLEANLFSGSDSSLMNANNVNDIELLRAGFGANPASVSNVGAKWGVRMVGRNDGIYDTGKSAAVYAVSEETSAGYNRTVGMALHTSSFDAANTEKVRITGTGNVGIGTTSPSYKLEVVGGTVNNQIARFITADYPTHSIGFGVDGAGSEWGASIFQDDVKRFTIEANGGILVGSSYQSSNAPSNGAIIQGNVGIGTTSPTVNLDVENSTTWAGLDLNGASGGEIRLQKSGSTYGQLYASEGTSTGFVINAAASGNSIIFQTAGAERMRLTSTGLGIGLSSPSYRLHVKSAGLNSVPLAVQRNANTNNIFYVYEDASGNGNVNVENSAGATGVFLNSSGSSYFNGGSVGIGTTNPTAKLHVVGANNTAQGLIVTGADPNQGNVAKFVRGDSEKNFYIGATNNAIVNLATEGSIYLKTNVTADQPYTTGTTTMVLTSGGLVGIGTVSPATKLEVRSNVAGLEAARFSDSNYADLAIGFPTAGVASIDFEYGAAGALAFRSGTGKNERMRITSDGNIGVGTSSPNGSSVERTIVLANNTATYYIRNTANTLRGIFALGNATNEVFIGTQTNHDFHFRTNDTRKMTILSGGNVGIGTSSPVTPLQINNTSPSIRLQETSSGGDKRVELSVDSVGVARLSANQSAQNLAFETVGSERMRITSGGNVGIGTTSPSYALDVNSTGNMLNVNKTSASAGYIANWAVSGSQKQYSYWNGTSLEFGVIGTSYFSSRVGIGTTSPDSILVSNYGTLTTFNSSDIRTTTALLLTANDPGTTSSSHAVSLAFRPITNRGAAATITVYNDSTNKEGGAVFTFNSGGGAYPSSVSERMRITGGGDVGIGTSSPATRLTVAGGDMNIASPSTGNSNTLFFGAEVQRASGKCIFMENYYLKIQGHRNEGIILQGTNGLSSIQTFAAFYGDANANSSQIHLAPSGGKVSIGNTSPQSRLDLTVAPAQSTVSTLGYSANASLNIRIPNSVGDVGQIVFTNDAAPTAGYASIGVVMTSGAGVGLGDIILSTKSVGNDAVSSERMRITSGGLVGIGTSSVNAAALLHLSSAAAETTLLLENTGTGGNRWMIRSTNNSSGCCGSSGNANLTFYNDSAGVSPLVLQNSGRVGIGTLSPLAKLSIGSGSLTDSNIPAQMSTGGAGTGAYFGWNKNGGYGFLAGMSNGLDGWTAGVVRMITTDPLYFITNNSSIAMAINSSQNIGIGTTSPTVLLHLEKNGSSFTAPSINNVPSIYINNTNSSSGTAHALVTTRVNGASAGDAFFSMDVNGVTGWSMGLDNSDSDKFKIANNWSDLSSNTRFTMETGGNATFSGNVTAAAFFESSDIRLKQVLNIHNGLDFGAIEFRWSDARDKKLHWGYAAQEVMKFLPDAIQETEDGFLTLDYNQVHTYKIAMLEKRIAELEKQLKNK